MSFKTGTLRIIAGFGALAVLAACHQGPRNPVYNPYEHYELGKVYDCDEGAPDVRHNTTNATTPGFGCSHQSNLTVMVADPADLDRARALTPPDEQARMRVLEAYREGGDTTTAPDAKGTKGLIE